MEKKEPKPQPAAPSPPPPRMSMFSADELVKGNRSIEYLTEPYIIDQSGRTSMLNLVYSMNLIAREKDYRITEFSVTDFFHTSSWNKRQMTRVAMMVEGNKYCNE